MTKAICVILSNGFLFQVYCCLYILCFFTFIPTIFSACSLCLCMCSCLSIYLCVYISLRFSVAVLRTGRPCFWHGSCFSEPPCPSVLRFSVDSYSIKASTSIVQLSTGVQWGNATKEYSLYKVKIVLSRRHLPEKMYMLKKKEREREADSQRQKERDTHRDRDTERDILFI